MGDDCRMVDLVGIRERDAQHGDNLGEHYADDRCGDCAVEDRRTLLAVVDTLSEALRELINSIEDGVDGRSVYEKARAVLALLGVEKV